ncbi:deoxyribodipyrimidine photo-lyase [Phaeobacter gallaeciensis]|uniref:Deoxyribodipyrimidine photo-lyase n=1 Tax=Phaeobacter gallaeciensis TaxID=60890 RepID=A0A1B0ZWA6_9RHOB|nr:MULTISPECIES: deoxyribodipyrimidine photo-lyase [Phaeobacter]MDF1770642.1 deoxyribodipyrimidine photo-lyase [Pseudophaeobacter sp. bin_em_oilr2.035]ANP38419.1 deoxyribodipyrimidine photo-lyase [Phaeobacter gallaeciensis]MDE4060243.1 deoxyribodipyrimidine photo-lyase [Phaeobacter gallaeciensis]MDE4123262.1 deoxyribodipyrimidine photo-lyase [Phaeobacter gallaeciensis]MDE4127621.1 deoxyribodipyrimidine photo-lyase [Phaeobacter gallaeciensis]
MTTILWFKRDLRIEDHPALAHAVTLGGPVLCLYVVEPELWRQQDASARQYDFLRQSLPGLREALRRRGADLVLRVGDAVEVLEGLAGQYAVDHLVSHEETGNGWTYSRDKRVAGWARARGIRWTELRQCGVVRGLTAREGWQRARNGFMGQAPVIAPDHVEGIRCDSDPMPAAADLGLMPDGIVDAQPGGRRAGLRCLDSFLDHRGQHYRRAMSSPLEGATACSRLSPHFAFGTLSVREVVQATKARQEVGRKAGWSGSLKSFQARLAWRDHFMQKLEDQPDIEHRCLHPAFEGLRPMEPDAARLAAWQRGETGLPFVDACMRSLTATGWLNFRMRAMVMSVASYHLWLDWRATGRHLARMFTDYEPGIHWSQVQMQSGTTGMNTLRIYNPVKQGLDQDPTGAFTRAWLPELAEVPDRFLQEPWKWQGAGRLLGQAYPAPIVDVQMAARAAREAVWAVRQQDGFRPVARRIVKKHASRKSPRARGRQVKQPAKGADQLSFDF